MGVRVPQHAGPRDGCETGAGKDAGQAADASVVANLAGRPATKDEVVAVSREVARKTGTAGHVTGHTTRVTGAQRLALAGVSEACIKTFGR